MIGARIQQARLAAGYHVQAQFCRAVGTDPPTLHRWERGQMVPGSAHLYEIAKVSRVSMEWLMDGEEHASAELLRWLETPKGKAAPPEARSFLAGLPLLGYRPSTLFYDLALVAWEAGLTPDEAARAAKQTARRAR